jgi:putative ABC transport system permease protein
MTLRGTRRHNHRGGGTNLESLQFAWPSTGVLDVVRESLLTVSRQPARAILAAMGTLLGIAVFQTTIGLSLSANASVTGAFNAQLATQVSFQETYSSAAATPLTERSETEIEKLPGVVDAGLIWAVDHGQPLTVGRTQLSAESSAAPDEGSAETVQLPITVASPGALKVMHAVVSSGRLYDQGFEVRHEMVGLLGIQAAEELGISDIETEPAVFVGPQAVTVIGIVGSTVEESQALSGVFIPPSEAVAIGTAGHTRTLIVNTRPGAAQVVAREGPLVLSPSDPTAIDTQEPPSPQQLRQRVESSVSELLFGLALLAFILGTIVIGNTTLLSVMQRGGEFGLRRAVGAMPRHIAALVFCEASVVGVLGGVAGGALSMITLTACAHILGWLPVTEWWLELLSPVFGIVAGILAGVYPSWRASRLEPIVALREQ